MSNLFNHTIQPIGSTTSPVEDLALEVAEAFDKIETTFSVEPKMISAFKEAIGDFSLEEIQPHKVTKNFNEVHNITSRESSFLTKAIPEEGSLSISYVDRQGTTKVLTSIPINKPFTDVDQFKINGKQIKLNLPIPKDSSISLGVSYRGETFSLGGKKFLPNVFKNQDGVYKIKAVETGTNSYELEYDRNINDLIEEFKISSGSSITFFHTEDGESWYKIETTQHSVEGNKVKFTSEDFRNNTDTYVTAYVNNTSLSGIINSLYKEFVEHKHGSEELTSNIDSYSLSNRVVNNERISYKDDNLINYQFPQYFNREGHNPNLDDVYENSILGNVFISRGMTEGSDKYKGLDKDSYSLVFGDPVTGPAFKYSREYQSVQLKSIENLNGLKIVTLDPSKWSLALNGSYFYSDTNSLKIKPQANLLDLRSEDPSVKNTVKIDDLITENSTNLKNTRVDTLNINDVQFKEHDNKIDAEIVSLPNAQGKESELYVRVPMNVRKFFAEDFNVEEGKFSGVHVGDVSLKKTDDNNLVIEAKNDKVLEIKANTKVDNADFNNLTFDSISFNKDDNNGEDRLTIHSTDPNSDIKIKVKTTLENAVIERSVQNNLKIGNVLLSETDNKDLNFTSEGNKAVVFDTPVEFKNALSHPGSIVSLSEITSDELRVGNIKFHKDNDNGKISVIDPDVEAVFDIEAKSNLKDTVIKKGLLESVTINNAQIGNSTIAKTEDGDVIIEPSNVAEDFLIIRTKVNALNASIETLTSEQDITANRLSYDYSKVGKVKLLKNSKDELEVDSEDETKVIFKAPVDLEKAVINNIEVKGGSISGAQVDGMKVGAIKFAKEEESDNLLVTREDTESRYIIEAPTDIKNLTTEKSTTELAVIEAAQVNQLDIGGVTLKKDDELNVLIENKDINDPKKLIFNSELEIEKATLKSFNTPLYRLLNKDKIELDANNYILNNNNRLTVVNNRAVDYIGSDKNSGIQFKHDISGNYSVKQYVSSNAGAKAVETERNFFFETDTTNGLYFIKNTNTKVSLNGTLYGFNDVTAQRNISDLTQWFRSDIYVGKVEASAVNLKTSDDNERNGLRIGSTRLSVIGAGQDCPEGLTVLESGDSIHLVQPISNNSNGCRDLTYQEVNTGALNVKGGMSVEGTVTLSDDFVANGTIAASNLAITDEVEVNNITVTGELKVSDNASFNSEVNFKNPVHFKNEVVADSTSTAKSFISLNNSEFQRDVEIIRDLNLGRDIAIGGSLVSKGSIKTDSALIGRSLEVNTLSAGDSSISGALHLNRELTVAGVSHFRNDVKIEGNLETSSKLTVKDSVTTDSIYAVKEVYSRGKLTALDGVELRGRTITIGDSDSMINIDGKLQFNTEEVAFNAKVNIFDTFKVAGETELNGKTVINSSLLVDGNAELNGNIIANSGVRFNGDLKGKSAEFDQTLTVRGSLTANSVTAESIVIDNNASISNLLITNSLSTNATTRLNAGEAHLSSVTTSDSKVDNSFAGRIIAVGGIECLKPLSVAEQITIGNNNNVVINNAGISTVGNLSGRTLKIDNIDGTLAVGAPPAVVGSSNRIANSIAETISARKFVKMNNFYVEGVSVFNSPVVIDTLLFRDMVYLDDSRDAEKAKGVNIVARKAYYG